MTGTEAANMAEYCAFYYCMYVQYRPKLVELQ